MVNLHLAELNTDHPMITFESMAEVYEWLAKESPHFRISNFLEQTNQWFLIFEAGQRKFELVIKWLKN